MAVIFSLNDCMLNINRFVDFEKMFSNFFVHLVGALKISNYKLKMQSFTNENIYLLSNVIKKYIYVYKIITRNIVI